MSPNRRRKSRHPVPTPELRCACGHELKRYWPFCPWCGRKQVWRDEPPVTDAECYRCGWVVSDFHSFCPWCGTDIYEEGYSSEPMKAPKGFRFDARCDWGCGGGLQYPMPCCPWCGRDQEWRDWDEEGYDGSCPHCHRGVNDWMEACPWCGKDPTGRDLIPRALRQVRDLLRASRVKDWGYRVVLRPGVSGVDPKAPKIIEIDWDHVLKARGRTEIPWRTLVGLICHEAGHSFLYHHWSWTRTPAFKNVFGEVHKAYRVRDDTWVDMQRRRVSTAKAEYVSAYASNHPLEDFAETFRFYVVRRGRMRELLAELGRKRKAVIVYEKFLALHHYLRHLRSLRRSW